MSGSKRYEVILVVNGEYYGVVADYPSLQTANECVINYRKAQDWFEAYTDYEFTHADDTWEVVVKELIE